MTHDDIETLRKGINELVRAFKIADAQSLPDGSAPLNPSDVQSLFFVSRHENCIANDLVKFLGVAPTSVTTIIDRLVRRGFLKRARTDENRRVVLLSLTQKGHHAVQAITSEQSSHCAAMLAALDPQDRAQFIAHIDRIAGSIRRNDPA